MKYKLTQPVYSLKEYAYLTLRQYLTPKTSIHLINVARNVSVNQSCKFERCVNIACRTICLPDVFEGGI